MPKKLLAITCILLSALLIAVAALLIFPSLGEAILGTESNEKLRGLLPDGADRTPAEPDELLAWYMSCVEARDYGAMYERLSDTSKSAIAKDDFIAKNKNIYEGIEAQNLTVSVSKTDKRENMQVVSYSCHMDTLAGAVSFSNEASFTIGEDKQYRLEWSPQMIFPNLSASDKVRVNTVKAERGCIYDRNGEMLAGPGIASSVGFVPGKMRGSEAGGGGEAANNADENGLTDEGGDTGVTEAPKDIAGENGPVAENSEDNAATAVPETREAGITKAAELLEMSEENINKRLGASYVKDDTFVALKTVPKEAYDLKELLLTIPGIKIVDTKVRFYPLGEKASHLIGYIQSISAQELDSLRGEGYNSNSVIGKAGLEKIYEDRLRAVDGYEIVIVDAKGEVKETLAHIEKRDGENLVLTIDYNLQSSLYDQFSLEKSCSVSMNPITGEVLALVSTPTYNANDFVVGMPGSKWSALNEDDSKPLWNRFKAALCPGSTFKAVTGAVGVTTEKIKPDDNFGRSGLRWRKDESWGAYYVTTLKDYGDEATLINALTYSDNIYFAKAALKIGGELFAQELKKIGFEERIPFEYGLYSSTISSTEEFGSEIQLADSGYGQGQILVNPVHFASIYSAFVNDGSMVKPYLIYKEDPQPEFWKENAFSLEAARVMRDALISVVEKGTGTEAKIKGITLGGKTGTAEIKQSKDDETGTELGWFALFTADPGYKAPLLIISMVEDVKDRGGSHFVSPKVKAAFEAYLKS